jgi:twitching motility protein PilT
MQTMDQCLRDLYGRGLISYDDALSRAMQPEELKKMISGGASPGQGMVGGGVHGGGRGH